MKFEVTILYTNEFAPEEIVSEEIPDKYLFNEQGKLTCASTALISEKTVYQLLNFLFQGGEPVAEVYRNKDNYVLDLSPLRGQLIDFDNLEEFYPKWIEETGRENNMDEYGMLLDFIGFARKGLDKKYLLMIVYKRLD